MRRSLPALLALAVTSTGCIIVPAEKRTETVIQRGTMPVVVGPAARFGLETFANGGRIGVRAAAPRLCTTRTYAIVDVKTETTATLDMESGGGREVVYLALLAPVTLAISGLITSIIVAASDDTTKRERRETVQKREPCPLFGSALPVVMSLPSGARVDLVTDVRGEARYEVPETEPEFGVVSIQVADQAARSVLYTRTAAGCQAARLELFARASRSTGKHRQALLDAIPRCNDDSLAWNEAIRAARDATFGSCTDVLYLDAHIKSLDPDLHATVFRPDPIVARCFATNPYVPRESTASCRKRRSELMLRAQRITNLAQRTRALTSLPDCSR